MATIRDVARLAGVSIATVSRVLNDNPRVKAHLQIRVEKAIRELNYQPSLLAQGMRSQVARVIGLIIPDIEHPYLTSLARIIEDTAHENGYSVLFCNSDQDPTKEKHYANVMLKQRVAGVILVPATGDLCEPLQRGNIPLVCMLRPLPDCPVDTVMLDNVLGGRLATDHLIALGHRRIALVAGVPEQVVSQERAEGYRKALQDSGIPYDPELVRFGGFRERGGYTSALELLDQKPTAIYVTSDYLAIGALRAVQERGIQVPEALSVVSISDERSFSLFRPPLTIVLQPARAIGREAANLLFQRIQDDSPRTPVLKRFAPELIVKGSTAAPPAD